MHVSIHFGGFWRSSFGGISWGFWHFMGISLRKRWLASMDVEVPFQTWQSFCGFPWLSNRCWLFLLWIWNHLEGAGSWNFLSWESSSDSPGSHGIVNLQNLRPLSAISPTKAYALPWNCHKLYQTILAYETNEYEQNLFAFWDVKPRSCFDHFCCNIIHALLPPSNPLPPALPTLLASHWHHCRLQQHSHSRLRPLDNFEPRGSSTWPHQAGEQGNIGKLFGHGGRSTTAGYNFLDLGVLNRGGVYQYWFKIQPTNGRDLKLVVGNAMQRDMADGIMTEL